jgi:hypothetical protein
LRPALGAGGENDLAGSHVDISRKWFPHTGCFDALLSDQARQGRRGCARPKKAGSPSGLSFRATPSIRATSRLDLDVKN